MASVEFDLDEIKQLEHYFNLDGDNTTTKSNKLESQSAFFDKNLAYSNTRGENVHSLGTINSSAETTNMSDYTSSYGPLILAAQPQIPYTPNSGRGFDHNKILVTATAQRGMQACAPPTRNCSAQQGVPTQTATKHKAV